MRPNDLLTAARAAVLELTTVGVGHGHTYSQVVIDKLQAAIKEAEKQKDATAAIVATCARLDAILDAVPICEHGVIRVLCGPCGSGS